MDKIKLVFIINRLIVGGAQKVIVEILNNLDSKRYDKTIIFGSLEPDGGSLSSFLSADIKKIFIKNFKREINLLNDFLSFIKIFLIIRKGKFNIIHTHTSKAGIIGRLAGILNFNNCLIHSVYGNVFNKKSPIKGAPKNFLLRFLLLNLERKLSIFTDKIIVTSEAVKKEYELLNIAKTRKLKVIYSWINFNAEYTTKLTNENRNQITGIFIGRLVKEKGLIYLLKALKKDKKNFEFFQLIIIGDGPLKSSLEDYVLKNGLSRIVRFEGIKYNIKNYLKEADFLILPSLYEGLGIVIIEAIASGLPVIATSVGGVLEILEGYESKIIVPPADSNAIYNAIIKMREKIKYYKKLAKNFDKHKLKKFDVSTMIKNIEKIYLKLRIKN